MRAVDGKHFSNISATTAVFQLNGGAYTIDTVATWNSTGTVTLERLGPDGSSYLTAATAISADGVATGLVLPPGTYRFAIATATAVYVSITRVPGE